KFSAISPAPASTARCTTSTWIGAMPKSFWSPAETYMTSSKTSVSGSRARGGRGSLYRNQHELIFVFKRGRSENRTNVQPGRFRRKRSNVWHYPEAKSVLRRGEEGNSRALPATAKPVAMVADAILDCSARGDIVLDSFLGSGTTLIAAERTGR